MEEQVGQRAVIPHVELVMNGAAECQADEIANEHEAHDAICRKRSDVFGNPQ